jgi:hypothetical protein
VAFTLPAFSANSESFRSVGISDAKASLARYKIAGILALCALAMTTSLPSSGLAQDKPASAGQSPVAASKPAGWREELAYSVGIQAYI